MSHLWTLLLQLLRESRPPGHEDSPLHLRIEVIEDGPGEPTEATSHLIEISNQQGDQFDREVQRLRVEIDLIQRGHHR